MGCFYHSVTYDSKWFYLADTYIAFEILVGLIATSVIFIFLKMLNKSIKKHSTDEKFNKMVASIKNHTGKHIYYVISTISSLVDITIAGLLFKNGYVFSGCLCMILAFSTTLYQFAKFKVASTLITNSHK